MENVLNLIRAERERQNKKWGEQNHDDYRWLAILTEEVGELAQAILHDEFGGSHAGTAKTELVHVAAVAVQWLECMERRQLTPRALDVCPSCDGEGTGFSEGESWTCSACHGTGTRQ